MMPLRRSVKLGVVPCRLIYGLNMAIFKSRKESPALTMGNDAHMTLTGVPQNRTGPVTSHPTGGTFGPC